MHTEPSLPIEQYGDRSAEMLTDLSGDTEHFEVFDEIRFGMVQYMRVLTGAAPDCNTNALPDDNEVAAGTSLDCQSNGVPDECDLADGASLDYNSNGIPDECDRPGDVDGDGDVDLADFAVFQVVFTP